MGLQLITAPATFPVSLAEAKQHLNISHSDDDSLINIYIGAATAHVDGPEGFLGRALVPQVWRLVLDHFPLNEIRIPLPPLISIESVRYDDGAGVEVVLAPAFYTVDTANEPGWVLPVGSWPGTFDGINAVRIEFRSGYQSASSPPVAAVPDDIRSAILLLVGNLYNGRENVVVGASVITVPWAAEQLLRRRLFAMSMA